VAVAQVLVRGLAQPVQVQVAVWVWAVARVGIRAQARVRVLAVLSFVWGQWHSPPKKPTLIQWLLGMWQ
jgi:hypothetical protein